MVLIDLIADLSTVAETILAFLCAAISLYWWGLGRAGKKEIPADVGINPTAEITGQTEEKKTTTRFTLGAIFS